MDQDYIKLKTLANQPIDVDGLILKPKTLSEIIEIGYPQFNSYLHFVSLRKKDLFTDVNLNELDYPLLYFLLYSEENDLLLLYLNSFSYFIGSPISFSPDQESLIINGVQYPLSVLESISNIIKIQNSYVSENDDDFNPLNDRARQLREKMLARKKKLNKLKQDSGNDNRLSLLDLISILCSNANGINIFNVFDMNFFQFNDQFNRMRMIDEYEVNIQALLHGADSKNIKLKHWMSSAE